MCYKEASIAALQNKIMDDIGESFISFLKSVVRPKGQLHPSSTALRTRML